MIHGKEAVLDIYLFHKRQCELWKVELVMQSSDYLSEQGAEGPEVVLHPQQQLLEHRG